MVYTNTHKIGKSRYYVGNQNAAKINYVGNQNAAIINYTQVNESERTKKYDHVHDSLIQMNNEIKKCFVCKKDGHIAKDCQECWKCDSCNKEFRNKKRCESHMYFCNSKDKAAYSHILLDPGEEQILFALESRPVLRSGATQTFGVYNDRPFNGNRSNVSSQIGGSPNKYVRTTNKYVKTPNKYLMQQKANQNYVIQQEMQQKAIQQEMQQKTIQQETQEKAILNYVSHQETQQKAIQNYVIQQEEAFQNFVSHQQVAFQNYVSQQTVFQNYALQQGQLHNYEFLHNAAYKNYTLQQEAAFKIYISQQEIIFQNYISQLVVVQKKNQEDMYKDLSRDIMVVINDEDAYHELSKDIMMIVNENNKC